MQSPKHRQPSRLLPRLLLTPAVATLALWMIVPLAMTIYFSLIRYNLMQPEQTGFIGLANCEYVVTDPSLGTAVLNTLQLIGGVIAITVVGGLGLALLVNESLPGRGVVRLLLIAPFFVMPTVNALMWKHMMMNPIYGVFAQVAVPFGTEPVDFMADWPLASVVLMVAWQWMPFACLIFITALASMNREQLEAARMVGAGYAQHLRYLVLPHLGRSIAVVVMIELIFLLGVCAEIFTTTGGGPGDASTNVAFLIFIQALLNFDAGVANAGALFAVVLAITAFKTELQAIEVPTLWWFTPTLENFAQVQERSDYLHHAWNSVITSVGSTLLGLAIAAPAAYSMAYRRSRHTRDILMWMVSTKMMPALGVLVPVYVLAQRSALPDTTLGLTIVFTLSNLPIMVWMRYSHFKDIPHEILEAARMDGAGLMSEFRHVLLPLGVGGLASTGLLCLVLSLNEAFWSLNLSAANAGTLAALIASYSSPEGLFWAKLSAASLLAIAPIVVFGWFSQKQLVQGLTFGAVK